MESVSSPARVEKAPAFNHALLKLEDSTLVPAHHEWHLKNRTASQNLTARLSRFNDFPLNTDGLPVVTPPTKVARQLNWAPDDSPAQVASPPPAPAFPRFSDKISARRDEYASTRPEVSLPKPTITAKRPRPAIPLRYPEQAAHGIINKKSFAQLERPGQLLVKAFCDLEHMFKLAEQTFGAEWKWTADGSAPLGDWAKRAITECLKINRVEYFIEQNEFKNAYLEGSLNKHFMTVIDMVKAIRPGPERAANILLLGRQADHVFNLALESISAMTRPKEANEADEPTHGFLLNLWATVVADKPSTPKLKRELAGYFPPQHCMAIQAFLNAMNRLTETVGQHLEPQKTRDEVLDPLEFALPHLLGFTFEQLQLIEAQRSTDNFRESLQRMGLDQQRLMGMLDTFQRDRTKALAANRRKKLGSKINSKLAPVKAEFDTDDVKDNLSNLNESELFKALNQLRGASKRMFKDLVNGDQRFQRIHGLNITESLTPPVTVSRRN